MGDAAWDVSNEDVLSLELLSVCSEELSVELKSSAGLAVDFEVLHLVASFFELLVIWNVYDSSPEWACDVLSDLGSLFEVNIGLVLEGHSDFLGVDFLLWEVVKIDQVLLFGCHGLVFVCGRGFVFCKSKECF